MRAFGISNSVFKPLAVTTYAYSKSPDYKNPIFYKTNILIIEMDAANLTREMTVCEPFAVLWDGLVVTVFYIRAGLDYTIKVCLSNFYQMVD